jgi:hypothetical protein
VDDCQCGYITKLKKRNLDMSVVINEFLTMNYYTTKDYQQFTRGKPETDPYELIRQSDQ